MSYSQTKLFKNGKKTQHRFVFYELINFVYRRNEQQQHIF